MSTTTSTEVATITPKQLQERCDSGHRIELIDVRTPAEYREVHAAAVSRLVPLDELDPKALLASRSVPADEPLYIICRSGNRANKACEKIRAAGFTNVVNVAGGTVAWEAAGLPVARGKKTISLERQVRIAAGALVFIGSLLGGLVNPLWFLLSGFVGAGLMFAGITDTCGMAMVLAKMPWNRVALEGRSCTP